MEEYNCDLHIHSKYSIATSRNLDFNSLTHSANLKGLHCLGTGDILQKDWLKEAEFNLEKRGNTFSFNGIYFILQTEIECSESIHHLVFLPDFTAVHELRKILTPYTANIDGHLAGRIRVSLSPEELVEKVDSVNGIIGPAHAFTPFKSIFRFGKFSRLEECYGANTKHIKFLELGLSADTYMADQLASISHLSFLSNSDAHSESLTSLGREFNRIFSETPDFNEIVDAFSKKNGRKIVLNAGLNPKMGKYYSIFCNKCRRRIKFAPITDRNTKNSRDSSKISVEPNFITFNYESNEEHQQIINDIFSEAVMCPVCLEEHETKKMTSDKGKDNDRKTTKTQKILKSLLIRPGVSDNINQLSLADHKSIKTDRPPYYHVVPLQTLIAFVTGTKNPSAKSNIKIYENLIKKYTNEINILLDVEASNYYKGQSEKNDLEMKLFNIVSAMRNNELDFEAGGGGTYGSLTGLLNSD